MSEVVALALSAQTVRVPAVGVKPVVALRVTVPIVVVLENADGMPVGPRLVAQRVTVQTVVVLAAIDADICIQRLSHPTRDYCFE